MKKSFFTLCSLLLFAFSSMAQPISDTTAIIINAHNASIAVPPVGVDSIGIVDLANSTLPSFAPATQHVWSLKNTSYSGKSKVTYFNGQNLFQYADSINYVFDSIHYVSKGMSYYVLQGRIRAKEIIDSQTLFVPTGTSRVDTIVFNYQEVFLSTPYVVQPYPLTYPQTPWTNSYTRNTYFTLRDVLLNLNHATARHYSSYSESASVIGWGKMVVNSLDRDTTSAHNLIPSDSLHVLQTQRMSIRIDSIFLPTVAPGISLYDTFHVQPAYADTTYERAFYRRGSLTPLVRVTYTDGSYSTVKDVEVHVKNLSGTYEDTIGTSVITVKNQTVTIYPNPVVNGHFFIDIPDGSANKWSYEIINTTGQLVGTGDIARSQGPAQISVPTLSPGNYFIRINSDNKPFGVKQIQVLNR